ncbi:MAG: pyruvate:ferredoxin (flavodoxin) oxidoreductase [Synechococcaceae cyanobacterium]
MTSHGSRNAPVAAGATTACPPETLEPEGASDPRSGQSLVTIDGNEAVARVAYRLSEVIAIYPITPATPMGEWADSWSAAGQPNLWGAVPTVVQMQSEGGAAGCVHGALQTGCLTTTFTASQGLLLMIPNLYRWVGELLPMVVHVASRALAAQALSIFGDHSDGMACRATGCAIVCSASVQEAGDMAAIVSRATLAGRLPVLHLFDGFRTSHEIQQVAPLDDATLAALIPPQLVSGHRQRALSPDHPVLRGTAQNPDVYFQGREAMNRFSDAFPDHLQAAMAAFAELTGRDYTPYSYCGHPEAERVLVLMGSACGTVAETLEVLLARGERVGMVQVRLFRPFVAGLFCQQLPLSCRAVAVLDRCKEPGASGEPLYLDVVASLVESWGERGEGRPLPLVIGCRYGLGSKEFTPAMAKAVLDHLGTRLDNPSAALAHRHVSVGIEDDVTHRSLPVDPSFRIEPADQVRAVIHGLSSDGSVGASRGSIRIIGEHTPLQVQAYIVYDSKKSGSRTSSHLRFGPQPIRSAYLIQNPTLVAAHQWDFVERVDLASDLLAGGQLLINSPFDALTSWQRMPVALRQAIRDKHLTVWLINAYRVAREAGLGNHINTVMQACFFAISGVLPRQQAIERIRADLVQRFQRKGETVLRTNLNALEASLSQLQQLAWQTLPEPDEARGSSAPDPHIAVEQRLAQASSFVRHVIGPLMEGQGDALPVSALPCDGTWPTGTAHWEKRNIAAEVPEWRSDLCIQCGKCVMVCPHAVIRAKAVDPALLEPAPAGFRQAPARDPALAGLAFTLQVAVEDCTGCALCVDICPAREVAEPHGKALAMVPQRPQRDSGRQAWEFFLSLPDLPRSSLHPQRIPQLQFLEPLFEFPGACAGCGETGYLKLISQLFGDRLLIANATGCSSIYGGNLPTTPWRANAAGRGPAWSNSLFEDHAEFGFGLRVGLDQQRQMAAELLARLAGLTPGGHTPKAPPPRAGGREPGASAGVSSQQTDMGDPDPADAATVQAQPIPMASAGAEEPLIPPALAEAILHANQQDEAGIQEQRQRVAMLKQRLLAAGADRLAATRLLELADALVKKSVWLVGGDGWAYDIGFGGLDHVLASGRDVNVLVLDTEVYSNTGGQVSKATPRGAVAKVAAQGKASAKTDRGLRAMTYGHVYVASVAMGARDEHTVRAFLEAESYPGPSLILAYSHCIAHGLPMEEGLRHQKLAVETGRWLLYRYDPRRTERGDPPLQLDSRGPKRPLAEAMATEQRFQQLSRSDPARAQALARLASQDLERRWALHRALAAQTPPRVEPDSGHGA